MRENIGLYRGKRIRSDEWAIGNLLMFLDLASYICSPDSDGGETLDKYSVDPETVGECSGIPDKNGTLMYEGDVVKGRFLFGLGGLSVVALKNGSFGLTWKRGGAEEFTAFASMCNIEQEIIGNIHVNPELLEDVE